MTHTQSTATPSSDLDTMQEQYEQLLGSFQSIQLSTVSAEGTPTASYSPSVLDDDRNFYIYVSEIADHTANLLETGKASFMVIEDEGTAHQIFARKRVSFHAKAVTVDRASADWENILGRFEEKFGRVMKHLKEMQDFHLIRLEPLDGRLVLGFGRAFSISPDLTQVEHLKGIDGKGHRKA
ncbi:MAG: HugZ family protein [Puniceicoccales bacterium]